MMKNFWNNLEEYIVIPLLLFAVILIFIQVIMRYVFRSSLYWSEELARYIFLWTVWIGASYATKKVKHLRIKSFTSMFPKRLQKYTEKFVLIIWLGFSVFLLYFGTTLTSRLLLGGQVSPALEIPMGYVYACVPVGCLMMSVRLLERIISEFKTIREHSEE
jgi:TRAP-type C4-dicarboxylate transport system permease small subunit